ncbi:MAG: glycosyltransferase family 87 protein [Candidatus Aminicenantales bacterium]
MKSTNRLFSRWWPVAVVAGLWAVLFFTVLKSQMIDFEVNYKAGFRLSEGETLYPGPLLDGHYEFKYPPFAALIYLPLSLLSLTAAKGIWSLLILAATAASIGLSLNLSDKREHPEHLALAFLAGLVLARFFLRELQLGQVNALVMLLLLTMTSALMIKEDRTASNRGELLGGLWWGLAVAVKPYSLIFLPYFLLKKRWKVLAAGLAALAAAFLIPVLFYGFKGNMTVHREWITTFSRSTPPLLTSQDNISLLALLAKWRIAGSAPLAAWAIVAGLLGLVMLIMMLQGRGLARAEFLECSALLLLIPLLSPLGWDYTFLSSLPALTLCFRHLFDLPRGGRFIFYANACLIFFLLYDLLGRKAYARLMGLSLPTLFFLVILGFLVHLRWKRLA